LTEKKFDQIFFFLFLSTAAFYQLKWRA